MFADFGNRLPRLHKSTWLINSCVAVILILIMVPGFHGDWHEAWDNWSVYQHGWPYVWVTRVADPRTPSDMDRFEIEATKPLIVARSKPREVHGEMARSVPPQWLTKDCWLSNDSLYHVHYWGLLIDFVVFLLILAVASFVFEWRRRRRNKFHNTTILEILLLTIFVGCFFAYWQEGRGIYEAESHVDEVYQWEFAYPVRRNSHPKWARPVWLERLGGSTFTDSKYRICGIRKLATWNPDESLDRLANSSTNFDNIESLWAIRNPAFDLASFRGSVEMVNDYEHIRQLTLDRVFWNDLRHIDLRENENVKHLALVHYPFRDRSYSDSYRIRSMQIFKANCPHLTQIDFVGFKHLTSPMIKKFDELPVEKIVFDRCTFEAFMMKDLNWLVGRKSVTFKECWIDDGSGFMLLIDRD
jgi:hypothetical protein